MFDRTPEFRQCLQDVQATLNIHNASKPRKPATSPERNDQLSRATASAYMQDAYTILRHIQALSKVLAVIRRPYLNVEVNDMVSTRDASAVVDLMTDGASLGALKYLTSQQRDQVDLQAKMIISRCAERVRAMEQVEQNREQLATSRTSKIIKLLPARLVSQGNSATLASDFLAAHNTSVTWYLNRRLAEVSQTQKEMQEERIKRQLERTKTLGSMTADPLRPTSLAPKASEGGLWPTSLGSRAKPNGTPVPTYEDPEDSEDEMVLSQSQIQQFEEENAAILREAQDALATVQQAESRLMEISALQMELVNHLTQQAEITDQLYEDAIEAGATVNAGNKQLQEARRRQKDSRLFILVFLMGASLALLFLHNY
ncbi:SubName: Full=Related to syntaxin 18 {ECO:0000313/EMBL:CCA71220.1} [Serendipita indica DSM 11827]|uniref:Related to syntaxin 18 n=1 Tax=Serendipita indica (strain DSM 11827) TaxID=1109443 RepID=G4TIS7_SERID|nr:SubName: Full=Related to syntaxin 18 {ECO:0000313/EMBL:CCA71220.1} [Serendipita indica DSM 11827]CCA71220.1 related to syntaxin 18 [Serendipita indica DSM 11827]